MESKTNKELKDEIFELEKENKKLKKVEKEYLTVKYKLAQYKHRDCNGERYEKGFLNDIIDEIMPYPMNSQKGVRQFYYDIMQKML